MGDPMVSAIVVHREGPGLLRDCLASLGEALGRLGADTELVVVDNGSTDGSLEMVEREFPQAQLLAFGENRGFAPAVEAALRRARGEWAFLLNDDATAARDALVELLEVGRRSADVGAVAAQMRFAGRGVINSAGLEVDRLGIARDRLLGAPISASEPEPVEVFGASAGAALFRRTMLREVGGFDESFFAYLEDADLAWRARGHGWRAMYAPGAVVHHRHSTTARHGSDFKYFLVGRNRVRMLAKNAQRAQLARYGLAMIAYDVAYVVFAGLTDRTLAPLRGRLAGLREWRALRRTRDVPPRRHVELARVGGLRAALTRRRAWRRHSATRRADLPPRAE